MIATHYELSNNQVACGRVGASYKTKARRKVDCVNCWKTKKFKEKPVVGDVVHKPQFDHIESYEVLAVNGNKMTVKSRQLGCVYEDVDILIYTICK